MPSKLSKELYDLMASVYDEGKAFDKHAKHQI